MCRKRIYNLKVFQLTKQPISNYCLWLIVALIGLSSFSNELKAQDPEFSQFYASPGYINPAMNGMGDAPRFTFAFRDQLTSFSNAYVTVFASYDQHFHKYRSSVGVNIMADFAGGLYNTYKLSAAYAYLLPLNEKYSIKAGFELSYLQNSINLDKIYFGDEIADGGTNPGTSFDSNFERTNKINFDAAAGIMFFSESFFLGVSAKHLTTPNVAFTNYNDDFNKLRIKSTATIGKTFAFGSEYNPKGKTEVVPNVLATYQAGLMQVNAGAWIGHGKIFGGFWLRHTLSNFDALIGMVGYRVGLMRIAYSYDQTISGLKTSAGAHELTISIDMAKNPNLDKKRRYIEMGRCPSVFK